MQVDTGEFEVRIGRNYEEIESNGGEYLVGPRGFVHLYLIASPFHPVWSVCHSSVMCGVQSVGALCDRLIAPVLSHR